MSRDVPATGAAKRGARAQAQRDRILDAAQRCFAERGFHGASMAMIAEAAQMSPGLIYRYFAGKSELIHGIVSRQIELMAEDLETFQAGTQDAATLIAERFREGACGTTGDGRRARMLEPALILEIVAESGRDPVIASGAGSGAQNVIGTSVLGGMIVGTSLGIFFIPLFYMVVVNLFSRKKKPHEPAPAPKDDAAAAGGDTTHG